MFCPQCKAEYRPGFTRCADCDVDLVYEAGGIETSLSTWEAAPGKWPAQLWHGTDPHFYLLLLGSLGTRNVPYLGRSVNPPAYDSFEEQPPGSYAAVEFEIRVSEKDLTFARWILRSEEELRKKDEDERKADTSVSGEEPGEEEVSPDIKGICPLCEAEFTAGFSVCPNCEAPLHAPGQGSQNPARGLCDLIHPQFLADLRTALRRARIPFNNYNFPEGPDSRRTDVVVLASDFERATEVLGQVLQYWEFDRSLFAGPPHDPRESYWPDRAEDNGWHPEDLTCMIWTGTNLGVLESIAMALREHEIAYRVETAGTDSAKIFIHPDEEETAGEISRDVVEGPAK